LRGRRQLEDFFAREVASRRSAATSDLFSRLCQTESDDGERFSDDEIVDHMIFVMMEAHDTTTSSLSSICYLLAVHPEWQARVRAELQAVPEPLAYERLAELPLTGYVLREALRLYPPLPSMRRRTVRDCEFDGHRLPADTTVNIFTHFTHHMPEYRHEPASFDPERFARNEHRRHPFQFIPFGAGAHTCIGMHFAELQVKAVLHVLLNRYRLSVSDGYRMPVTLMPINKPRDGLPLTLTPL
jgi:cytochrome P450